MLFVNTIYCFMEKYTTTLAENGENFISAQPRIVQLAINTLAKKVSEVLLGEAISNWPPKRLRYYQPITLMGPYKFKQEGMY